MLKKFTTSGELWIAIPPLMELVFFGSFGPDGIYQFADKTGKTHAERDKEGMITFYKKYSFIIEGFNMTLVKVVVRKRVVRLIYPNGGEQFAVEMTAGYDAGLPFGRVGTERDRETVSTRVFLSRVAGDEDKLWFAIEDIGQSPEIVLESVLSDGEDITNSFSYDRDDYYKGIKYFVFSTSRHDEGMYVIINVRLDLPPERGGAGFALVEAPAIDSKSFVVYFTSSSMTPAEPHLQCVTITPDPDGKTTETLIHVELVETDNNKFEKYIAVQDVTFPLAYVICDDEKN
jgi:hypothetical protein